MSDDRLQHGVSLEKQSVEVLGTNAERMSHLVKGGVLPTKLFDDAKTMYEGFRRGLARSGDGDCLGYRSPAADNKYVWLKYSEVIKRSEHVARGLLQKGLQVGQGSLVGIYAVNRPEWIIVEQACYIYSMINVPLYDTLGMEACVFILKQADLRILFVDKSLKAEKLLDEINQFPALSILVLMDKPEASLINKANAAKVDIVEFGELEHIGRAVAKAKPDQPPSPNDLATICYSSGTTGTPKGAMLTHANVMSDLTAIWNLKRGAPTAEDVMVSYLPLAHMFERVVEYLMYTCGAKVGFYRGDIKTLSEDLQVLKPTIMPTVPRLLNRIYDKVMHDVNNSFFKQFIFSFAMSSKLKEVRKGIVRNNSFWDRWVFGKIQATMGGRLRLLLTGSAPLSNEVMDFCRATMGCIVVEGYGQTECVAGATLTIEGDFIPGHVGPPIACCKIKFVDVADMGYLAKNGSGEVCIFGPHVMKGYYKDAERTAESLDPQGWLHTGDIGMWTQEGTLKLIDRKKHIFKLSQGEYIAPEKIEQVYNRSRFVAQCFVYGESLKSCVVGIVIPDFELLFPAVEKELGIKGTTQEMCQSALVKLFILNDMHLAGQKAGLSSFEQVKAIYLHPDQFTVENNLLTPTFKTRRVIMVKHFKDQLEQLYRLPETK